MNLSQDFATALLDPGGIARMIFILVVIVVEFYFLRRYIARQHMATKQQLQDAIDQVTVAVTGEISRVTKSIQDLQGQISAGATITEADLDAPVTALNSLRDALNTVDVTDTGSVSSQIPGSTGTTA